ncbi:hypothetical protein [Acidovorax sp. Leaf78]|uniref:hypothetical protein n=1 Tax=unclassified Acidovorax TaxID=2684926 RepID=UPI000A56D6AC|nr:hypothetical protein [Acidovorax sp. Leaf78]
MRNSLLVATVLIFLSNALQASQSSEQSTLVQVYPTNKSFSTALMDVKKTLIKSRTPIKFENGALADNCTDYLTYLATSATEETVINEEVHSEYLTCEALYLISKEKYIVSKNNLLSPSAARKIFEHLDFRSFPSSLRNRADDQQHTFKTLLPSSKVKLSKNSIEVENSEQFFGLKIVGVVRRTVVTKGVKATKTEWIVWIGDERKDGNYKSYSTMVVTPSNPSSNGPYIGSIYPPGVSLETLPKGR